MSVSYDYYRIFYYVAKYQNFTQAANVLMNNQPNISRSISNLEHELGCQLFIRSNRGVKLTPEGKKLFTRVAAAFYQLQAAEEELADARTLNKGVVSIGVSETALHTLLLPRLQEFHTRFPDIRIRISSVTTPQAIASLRSGFVDFAVVTTPTYVTRPLKEIVLSPFQELLVGGPSFAPLSSRTLKLAELPQYPFILLNSQTSTHNYFLRFFLDHGVSIHPEIEVATTDQILPMIKYDLGIGFLPASLAREALEKKEVFEIKLECQIPSRSVCIVQDTSRPTSIAARELEKMLQM